MALSFKIVTTESPYLRTLKKFPSKFLPAIKKAFNEVGRGFISRFKAARMSGHPGLKSRTGKLKSALLYRVRGLTPRTASLEMGWFGSLTARIASIHEFGTVGAGGTLSDIVPRRRKALTVPLPGAYVGGKVVPARAWKNTFARHGIVYHRLRRVKGGKRAKDTIIKIFLLRKKIAVPATLGFGKFWASRSEVSSRKSIFAKLFQQIIK